MESEQKRKNSRDRRIEKRKRSVCSCSLSQGASVPLSSAFGAFLAARCLRAAPSLEREREKSEEEEEKGGEPKKGEAEVEREF